MLTLYKNVSILAMVYYGFQLLTDLGSSPVFLTLQKSERKTTFPEFWHGEL